MQPAPSAPPQNYPIHILTIHDGDTLTCDIDLGFGFTYAHQTCRLFGFDAWEINRVRRTKHVSDAEIVKGKAARAFLVGMVTTGHYVTISPQQPMRDVYGRLLVSMTIDGKDVA